MISTTAQHPAHVANQVVPAADHEGPEELEGPAGDQTWEAVTTPVSATQ